MRIEHDVALGPLTTLGIGGHARRLVHVETLDELREALSTDDRVLVLGGGSNLVIGDDGFDGTVIRLAFHDRKWLLMEPPAMTVGAGVVWDDLVAEMVASGYAGIECLSGIPGLVGATPIQNVGAYGQELSDVCLHVIAYDRDRRDLVSIARKDCGFGYRTSMFRGSDRWVVCLVAITLTRSELSMPIRYAELAKALGIADGERAPLQQVRDTVIALRRGKGMVVDPADPESRSAGSFFTNPLVDSAQLAELARRLGEGVAFPSWPAERGLTKLSAAWLIERAGFAKGFTVGNVGISSKHALALVNRGGATSTELLALARQIQATVHERFAIELAPEPIIVQ